MAWLLAENERLAARSDEGWVALRPKRGRGRARQKLLKNPRVATHSMTEGSTIGEGHSV